MKRYRRNADEGLRRLERAASQGDQEALDQLVREKIRLGLTGDLTLSELRGASPGVVPPGLVADYLPEVQLRPFQRFTLRAWGSDPYDDEEDAARFPILVEAGQQPNDAIEIEVPVEGVDWNWRLATIEYVPNPDRLDFWLWKPNTVGEEDSDHLLAIFPFDQPGFSRGIHP